VPAGILVCEETQNYPVVDLYKKGRNMDDVCLTWISKCTPDIVHNYLVYVRSLQACNFSGHIVILTDDMSESIKILFKAAGCLIEDIRSWDKSIRIDYLLRDRHLAFWQYLNRQQYDYVLITDSRDVCFQVNPMPYLRRCFWNKSLILSSEGFMHRESPFNMIDQIEAQRNVRDFDHKYVDWPVVNGGVIVGRAEFVKNFCFLVWTNCVRAKGSCTDQGIINYLFNYLQHDSGFHLVDPNNDPLVVTGEGIKCELVPVTYKDDLVCMPDGRPFYIFHQWDRVEGMGQSILNRHSL
jgi:hypothetical protein